MKNQLTSFKEEEKSLEDYVSRLTKLVKEVKEAVVALDDGESTLISLSGLDSSYGAFVTTQMGRVDDIPFSTF